MTPRPDHANRSGDYGCLATIGALLVMVAGIAAAVAFLLVAPALGLGV